MDIKPTGMDQGAEVDLLYQIMASIQGICTKLDADGGVPLTTYLANCYTAIFTIDITDTKGNTLRNGGRYYISPRGIGDDARVELLYEIFNAWETLTEQLDTDALTDSTYEALCYTAKFLGIVTNKAGSSLGNGTAYYFGPVSAGDMGHRVDLYYNIVDAIETLTEQLDGDGTVTDTNYEALWFTAVVLTKITNSKGQTVGN